MAQVLDRNQFTPGRPLGTGTLWVGEQIPALYVYADVTPQLERGYWPSYNVVKTVNCNNVLICVIENSEYHVHFIPIFGTPGTMFPALFPRDLRPQWLPGRGEASRA